MKLQTLTAHKYGWAFQNENVGRKYCITHVTSKVTACSVHQW